MMNETLRERIDWGFKIFADKLDLVNEKWAFLERKNMTLQKQKVTDPQVSHIFPHE